MTSPSPNGRNARGRFAKGNLGGPGNPYARRVADLRAALLESVTEQDIRAVARALVKRAKEGEVPAVRELLDRLLGRTADAGTDRASPPIIDRKAAAAVLGLISSGDLRKLKEELAPSSEATKGSRKESKQKQAAQSNGSAA
jgi:hypothetical protein